MPTPKEIPDVAPKSRNTMRNPRYAQKVVETVNGLASAAVVIGSGASGVSTVNGKTVIFISIDEIIVQLRSKDLI